MVKTAKIESGSVVYQKTTLPNGLRVVTERLPSVRSISIGVWADVGSRHEQPSENGLSHFIEHLVFKGTRSRNAKQIAASLESIGGSLNAFTSKEHTCYTARVLDEHLYEALDILSDITCHATMTPTNMNRERQVICEEIKESLDTPADHIHDLFARTFWGNHPLGQPIMGPQETIRNVTRRNLLGFRDRHYRAGSIVIAASGAVSHRRLVKLARDKFDFVDGLADTPNVADRIGNSRVMVKTKDNSQTHFCLGFPGLSFRDERKMAVMLMTSHLGGGMSSVLFQKIREQRGLAYSVYCYHDFLRDSGMLGVYLGTDHTHVREAYDIILTECSRLKKKKLSDKVLSQVKAQLKGHLMLGLESTSNRAVRIARYELMTGSYQTLKQTIKAIDCVTVSDVQEMANSIFDESQMAIAVLGPVDQSLFSDVT